MNHKSDRGAVNEFSIGRPIGFRGITTVSPKFSDPFSQSWRAYNSAYENSVASLRDHSNIT